MGGLDVVGIRFILLRPNLLSTLDVTDEAKL